MFILIGAVALLYMMAMGLYVIFVGIIMLFTGIRVAWREL